MYNPEKVSSTFSKLRFFDTIDSMSRAGNWVEAKSGFGEVGVHRARIFVVSPGPAALGPGDEISLGLVRRALYEEVRETCLCT